MKPFYIALLSIVLIPRLGLCWSAPGHQAIAEAALQMLHGTPTEAKVNSILGDEAIADAAIWLDQVREHFHFDNADAQDEADQFTQDFPNSSNWHFSNYPVGSTEYSVNGKYSTPDDVVHSLETAILVLEGQESKMTKIEALRAVIHLVGDIHQPLHCITGFYDLSDMQHPKLLTDVNDPATAPQDRGGNQLYYTLSQEFHALWDLGLPRLIDKDTTQLASDISVGNLGDQATTAGDYHHWPEIWAGESMKAANAAYEGISFGPASIVTNPRHPESTMLKIMVKLPGGTEAYKADQKSRVETQLNTAAIRLAQLLEKIQFQ